METTTTQTAIEMLAADPTLAGCTWDERGITPVRDPSAAPLPLRDCGIFRCPTTNHLSHEWNNWYSLLAERMSEKYRNGWYIRKYKQI